MNASPLKLKDGTWGAKLEGERPEVGAKVTITTRGGKSWSATVTEVVWSSTPGDLHYVRTLGDDPPRRSRRRGTYARIGGVEIYCNANGRCEDAPCCGCCS